MAKYYGIDLGTTNTCLAIYDSITKDTIVLKPIGQGDLCLLPSVVFYKNKTEVIVGKKARARIYNKNTKPNHVISNFKPELGTGKTWEIFDQNITPIDLSAQILKNIKETAKYQINHDVTSAVITCPATFGAKEREAIKEAAVMAGISIDSAYGLVDEPSAAAYDLALVESSNLIIVDLGGGTLDISLIECEKNKSDAFYHYKPINNGGRKNLGGRDWDEKLISIINQHISKLPSNERNNLTLEEIKKEVKLQNIIALEAQHVKSELSIMLNTSFEFCFGDFDFKVTISRDEFEKETKDLLKVFISYLKQTLDDYPLFKADKLVLVGGSTLMPQIKQGILDHFPRYKNAILFHDEPFYSVARGAAKYKYLAEQGNITNRLYDSYAIGLANDTISRAIKNKTKLTNFFFKGLILQESPLVESKRISVQTTLENQSRLSLGIYQNKSLEPAINFIEGIKIGTVHLILPESVPKGSVYHLHFYMNTNKMLSVRAQEDQNNKKLINQAITAKLKL